VISGDGGLARQVRHQARDAVLRLISAVRLWMCGVSGPVDSTSLQRTLTVSRILPVLQYWIHSKSQPAAAAPTGTVLVLVPVPVQL
jgi:hypothetical protein